MTLRENAMKAKRPLSLLLGLTLSFVTVTASGQKPPLLASRYNRPGSRSLRPTRQRRTSPFDRISLLGRRPWLRPVHEEPIYVPDQEAVILDDVDPGGNGGWEGEAGSCPDCGTCAPPVWAHRTTLFGEYLYLRPRDAEIVYAAPVDGAVTPPGDPANPGNQVGALGVLDPDYNSAYRIGFWWARDDFTSFGVTYARFESTTRDSVSVGPGDFIQSLVTHPGVLNAEDNWQVARARLDVDFDLLDVDYRWLIVHDDRTALNFLVGVRYGRLQQGFDANFLFNGSRSVSTDVDFEGAGLRVGIDAERYAANTGWMVYGKSSLSLLAGSVSASYQQSSSFASQEINARWKAGRVVPVLDLELGFGWRSRCDRLRLTAGYVFSAWYNTVATDQFITDVTANRFAGLGNDQMTFDGLVARAEWRF